MLYRKNFPKLWSPWDLSFAQILGRHSYGKRGLSSETSENQPQNEVFGLISSNFQHCIKNRNICSKSEKNLTVLGELWPKNHPRAPKNGIFCCSENIWTFITWKPQMLYLWNLPGLCISMRPFIWQKIGVPPIGRRRAWPKNNQKMLQISQTFHFNLT